MLIPRPTETITAMRSRRGGSSAASAGAGTPPGGRGIVITYHSGEDRIAKDVFRRRSTVERPAGWTRSIFQTRQGPELWWPFLLTVFGLMLLETMMATSGERSPLSRQGDELD